MSKTLASLLGRPEPEITKIISKLEEISGHPSEDVRLLADIRAILRKKTLDLGLDPSNTTGQELHHGLIAKLSRDSEGLTRALGLSHLKDADSFCQALISLIEHSSLNQDVWVLKKSVAKDLLRQSPPKNLMKVLNCRSVDSMLKKYSITELYAALPFTESPTWLNNFWRQHQNLKPGDFEVRTAEFIVMPEDRWAKLTPNTGTVTCMLQLGVAAIWPMPSKFINSAGFNATLLVFEAVEAMRIYSASLKYEQANSNFGRRVTELMQEDLPSPIVIENMPLDWASLHFHYAKLPATHHPGSFEPHLQAEDMHKKTASEFFSEINPAFSWWVDNNHIASLDNQQPVSLNLADLMTTKMANLAYGTQMVKNAQKCLFNELVSRYLKHSRVEEFLLSQLDKQSLNLETKGISFISKRDNLAAAIAAEVY